MPTFVDDENTQFVNQLKGTGDYNKVLKTYEKSLTMDALTGVFGVPYQFLPSVDTRLKKGDRGEYSFGRKYAEKIANRMPLMYFSPGNPRFMPQVKNSFEKVAESFVNFLSGDVKKTILTNLIQDYPGKYYYIDLAYTDYYHYVNPMCRLGAEFLGIATEKYKGVELQNFPWHLNRGSEDNDGGTEDQIKHAGILSDIDDALKKLISENFSYYRRCIPFYIESDTQITDSMSNDTTESTLSGTVNSFSDQARELQFILGYTTSELGIKYEETKDNIESFTDKINSIITNNNSNLFRNIVNGIKTVSTGGRLVFPEIWSDSKFGKSYNITIKLATPDKDLYSWYLNIYVPLVHLLALALPRQNGTQGYSAPFLVRAYYKGFFNIDMGIITNMTVNKGKESGWTRDGLPTYVEVQIEMKDLYQELSIGAHENWFDSQIMTNTAELDYLANLCGVNINAPDIERLAAYYWAINKANIGDKITLDIWGGLQDAIGNFVNSGWNTLIGRI